MNDQSSALERYARPLQSAEQSPRWRLAELPFPKSIGTQYECPIFSHHAVEEVHMWEVIHLAGGLAGNQHQFSARRFPALERGDGFHPHVAASNKRSVSVR